ncbi:hypothetical protein MMC06_000530 [Schaereria dolodes]|nr:hypothetical protein [Schaereria dolodes]
MLGPSKQALLATILLLVIQSCCFQAAGLAAHTDNPGTLLNPGDASTCRVRSVNYITQTLAQQCLSTSWSSHNIRTLDQQESLRAADELDKKGGLNVPSQFHGESPTEYISSASLSTTHEAHQRLENKSVSELRSTSNTDIPSIQTPESEQEQDADSLLDNSNFLSFEEWKSQMLQKAGQSPDDLSNTKGRGNNIEARRRPGSLNNALDSLGEDAEIELDFSGFVNKDAASQAMPSRPLDGSNEENDPDDEVRLPSTSKDAGKTFKERFNYASFDCAATVLKTNSESKGSTFVLVENKDSYMLNKCSANNKFFIVELCDDILIDTIVLGNFEFFSSTFRTFRVSVSDRYPVKLDKWRDLGTFEARNSRDVQAFLVKNPLIWARYLRIEFVTHYGNEYYCPVSLLRVHGKTMMDDYKHDFKGARGDEDSEDDGSEMDSEEKEEDTSDVVASALSTEEPNDKTEVTSIYSIATRTITLEQSVATKEPTVLQPFTVLNEYGDYAGGICFADSLLQYHALLSSSCDHSAFDCPFHCIKLEESVIGLNVGQSINTIRATEVSHVAASVPANDESSQPSGSIRKFSTTTDSILPSTPGSAYQDNTKQHKSTLPQQMRSGFNDVSHAVSKTSGQPPSAQPTTQESFFKSIHKRLQLLESNSTLSLQYIEEQSRILREAFTKVEKRQLSKTTTFLENLNTTVLNELREFREQYDQIWQSTVLELSSQREQSQREVVALSTRLTLLADEILFQKRMAIVQFILILLCLGLIIFSRGATASSGFNYLELPPLVQNMVNKSSTSFSRYAHLESPPGSPSPTRPDSRYGLFSRSQTHQNTPSNESNLHEDSEKSPDIEYSPPPPVSDRSESADTRSQTPALSDSLEADFEARLAHSSPATPNGKRARGELMEWHGVDGALEEVLLRPSQHFPRLRSPLRDDGNGTESEDENHVESPKSLICDHH